MEVSMTSACGQATAPGPKRTTHPITPPSPGGGAQKGHCADGPRSQTCAAVHWAPTDAPFGGCRGAGSRAPTVLPCPALHAGRQEAILLDGKLPRPPCLHAHNHFSMRTEADPNIPIPPYETLWGRTVRCARAV